MLGGVTEEGAGIGVTATVGGTLDGELGLEGNTVTVMGSVSGPVELGIVEVSIKVRFAVTLLEGSDAVTVTTGREKVEFAGSEVLKTIVLLTC